MRDVSIGETTIEGHLNNFEQVYGGHERLGEDAKTIGFKRNVEGQGMPGTNSFVENQVQTKKNENVLKNKEGTASPPKDFPTEGNI